MPDRDTLQELYEGQGLSTTAIGVRYGVANVTVATWLRRSEIRVRNSGGKVVSPPSFEHLYQLYVEKRLSLRSVGDRFGVQPSSVHGWLQKRGIPTRPLGTNASNHRVLSVEPAGHQDVYDIEVPEHHNFVANGVVVHNSGKTTVVENATPWPSMLTRSGSLHSHFRLRDSRREIRFRDMLTDELYRAVILIDAKTGKREHQIYRDDTPLCEDGSTDRYTETLERLLGPRSLYLLTVVTPQKPVPIRIRTEGGQTVTATTDITSASRSERRAILRELLWLSSYQIASQQATEHSRSHATEAGTKSMQADSLRMSMKGHRLVAATVPRLQQEVEGARQEAEDWRRIEDGARTKHQEAAEAARTQKAAMEALRTAEQRLVRFVRQADDLEAQRASLEATSGGTAPTDEEIADLSWQLAKTERDFVDVEQHGRDAMERYNLEIHAHIDASVAVSTHREAGVSLRVERDNLLGSETICRTCEQPLRADRLAAMNVKLKHAERRLEAHEKDAPLPVGDAPRPPQSDPRRTELMSRRSTLQREIDNARANATLIGMARVQREGVEQQIELLREPLLDAERALQEARAAWNRDFDENAVREAYEVLSHAQRQVQHHQERFGTARANLEHAQRSVAEVEMLQERVEALVVVRDRHIGEVAAWNFSGRHSGRMAYRRC